jgi:hypothetical protein
VGRQENHFHKHFGREARKRSVVSAASPFLDGVNAPFDLWNVLVLAGSVQVGMEGAGNVCLAAFKFHVCMDLGDFKTTLKVGFVDVVKTFDKGGGLVIGKRLGRDEMNIS